MKIKVFDEFIRENETICFLGEQDIKGFGFFRHVSGSDLPTFFGMKLADMERNGWKKIG